MKSYTMRTTIPRALNERIDKMRTSLVIPSTNSHRITKKLAVILILEAGLDVLECEAKENCVQHLQKISTSQHP